MTEKSDCYKDTSSKQKNNSINVWLFLSSAFIGRICQGFFTAIFSPTLLFLAENVNESVAAVSPVFTARSLGFMLAALSAGYFLRRKIAVPVLGCSMLVCSVCLFLVPYVTQLSLLFIIVTISGMIVGYLDASLQGIILNLWGEKNSRMFIQLYHLAFTVGAFMAPLIAKPFLEAASFVTREDARCPGQNNISQVALNDSNPLSTNATLKDEGSQINPINYIFIIAGVFAGVLGIIYLILAYFRITNRIKKHRLEQDIETEKRPEEPIRSVFVLFILISLFYFFLAGCEQTFIGFIYPIAVCSRLKFSASNASLINSVFWGGFMLSRLFTAVVANYFKPRNLVIFFLSGTVSSSGFLALFGQDKVIVSWIVTFLCGFFVGPIYPSFVSWIFKSCNISGKYISVVNVGTGIGIMALTPLIGVIFDLNPFSTIYFIFGSAAMTCVVFFILIFYQRRRSKIKSPLELSSQAEYLSDASRFVPDVVP